MFSWFKKKHHHDDLTLAQKEYNHYARLALYDAASKDLEIKIQILKNCTKYTIKFEDDSKLVINLNKIDCEIDAG